MGCFESFAEYTCAWARCDENDFWWRVIIISFCIESSTLPSERQNEREREWVWVKEVVRWSRTWIFRSFPDKENFLCYSFARILDGNVYVLSPTASTTFQQNRYRKRVNPHTLSLTTLSHSKPTEKLIFQRIAFISSSSILNYPKRESHVWVSLSLSLSLPGCVHASKTFRI